MMGVRMRMLVLTRFGSLILVFMTVFMAV